MQVGAAIGRQNHLKKCIKKRAANGRPYLLLRSIFAYQRPKIASAVRIPSMAADMMPPA